jgi:hypothetical protein
MLTCTIDKLRFDEMFLELQKVVPQDAVEFVRDETARLSEECANQLSMRRGGKKISTDVGKVFSKLPTNAFTRQSQIDGHGMKWLSAGDRWLYGVKPLRYHVEDSVEDMRRLFYKSKGAFPDEKRITLGTRGGYLIEERNAKGRYRTRRRGHQTVYEVQRLVVKRRTYAEFLTLLKSHIGRLEASFAQTAQRLRGRAKVKARVSRHFPSQTNIHNETGLSNPSAPGMTFGSFAPGVTEFGEYIELALAVRVIKMEQRWALIVGGYCKEMTASLPPKRMAAITATE